MSVVAFPGSPDRSMVAAAVDRYLGSIQAKTTRASYAETLARLVRDGPDLPKRGKNLFEPRITGVDSIDTFSTRAAFSSAASALISGTAAVTSHVREVRRAFPGPGGSGRHTIAVAFATSIPATRSYRSW